MRDDLIDLFRELVTSYKKKLHILEEITGNETQLRFFLQSDKISEVSDLIQSDNDLFAKIDAVEFDIQSLITKICKISGIEKNDFNNYFPGKRDDLLSELKRLKEQTNKYISELIKERDWLIINMEKKLAEIKVDIDTLNLVRNLNLDKIH